MPTDPDRLFDAADDVKRAVDELRLQLSAVIAAAQLHRTQGRTGTSAQTGQTRLFDGTEEADHSIAALSAAALLLGDVTDSVDAVHLRRLRHLARA